MTSYLLSLIMSTTKENKQNTEKKERNNMDKKMIVALIDRIIMVILVVLKLTGVINWSWAIVLLPFYINLVIGAVCYTLAAIIIAIKKKK